MAWHFVNTTLRDGSPIPADGEWLEYNDHIVICRYGLHASDRISDALKYAPGWTLCNVECEDIRERHNDKFVCARRRINWRLDARDIILGWSRRVASDVLHLWDAPEIVKQFLTTGDAANAANAAYAAAYAANAADAAYAAYAAAYAAANAADAANAAYAADAAANAAEIEKYNQWLTDAVMAARGELC